MARTLYDLLGADNRRYSPFCWRIKMALAHKGLDAEDEPCGFTEMEKVAFSGGRTVPVLVDGDSQVRDSWAIAEYLEETYPEAPSLFGGAKGQTLARFVSHWCDTALHPPIFRLIVADIFEVVRPEDQAYFRESRERRIGMTLEEANEERAKWAPRLAAALTPLRAQLGAYEFVSGAAPAYADYIVFGAFEWARCSSPQPLLAAEPVIAAWRERMLDLFDGLARKAPALEEAA
ncbi:MAG: glutathione S-transferase N-terminal domain-containing protein [Alphaproteobacteria bacterium]